VYRLVATPPKAAVRPVVILFCPSAMRIVARLLTLMALVLGLSVAFAWAWDRSDRQQLPGSAQNPATTATAAAPMR
jgi:hypothetical protein